MTIVAEILDSRVEGDARCFLSKMTLEEYVRGLPDSYREYDIQRGIISNSYLDHLVDTVISGNHIPPIVLVVSDGEMEIRDDALEIKSFKILDGLQRTYRLQAIRKTIAYCIENIDAPNELLEWSKVKLSRKYSAELRSIDSSTSVLRVVIEAYSRLGKDGLLETFTTNFQWFEVWSGLDPRQEVKKMLMLNAGHKSVSLKHQLELLFLNLFPIFDQDRFDGFRIRREKEVSAAQFSKKRTVGEFLFAHLIGSLLSFHGAKPIVPTQDLIQTIQSDEANASDYEEIMEPAFLQEFVEFLLRVDRTITESYAEIGTIWMGREVTLAGLFGALGDAAVSLSISRIKAMESFLALVQARPDVLNLGEFEQVRNSLDLSKVNIGTVNRRAVFDAVGHIMRQHDSPPVDWNQYFRVSQQ